MLDGIDSRVKMTEDRIHELENGSTRFTQYEQQGLNRLEKTWTEPQRLVEQQEKSQHLYHGNARRKGKKVELKKICKEIKAKNIPSLVKDADWQI